MTETRMSRREFLIGTGGLAVAALTGCEKGKVREVNLEKGERVLWTSRGCYGPSDRQGGPAELIGLSKGEGTVLKTEWHVNTGENGEKKLNCWVRVKYYDLEDREEKIAWHLAPTLQKEVRNEEGTTTWVPVRVEVK